MDEISCHTTRTPNLHYLESGRGRYGAGKEGLRIKKIWRRLILWKPSSLLSQGRSRARQGGARPKAPQGHKYTPLDDQGGVINPSSHQRAAETKEKHREEADGRRVLELPRRWLRPCPSRHGWPCVVKPWWSSGAATRIRQVVVPSTFGDVTISCHTLIYYELCLFICVATICL
jgi:hypothetical protein